MNVLSLMFSLKGSCQTIIGTRTAGLDALRLAAARIASGEWNSAIVGAAEEYDELVNETYRHCGLYARGDGTGFTTSAGAVTLILESRESLERRGGRARARVGRSAGGRATSGETIHLTDEILRKIGDPSAVMSSANATWIDRAERAGITRNGRATPIGSFYRHTGECFSVTPLAAIAGVLALGHFPDPALDSPFGVLCTDYSSIVSGAEIVLIRR